MLTGTTFSGRGGHTKDGSWLMLINTPVSKNYTITRMDCKLIFDRIPKHTRFLETYVRLINRALKEKPEGYVERHHIVPKSMGGSNDETNIIKLTPKQHFVAHHLLWRAFRDNASARSFHFLCHRLNFTGKISAREYDKSKRDLTVSSETREKLRNSLIGRPRRPHTDETKAKMSKSRTGMVYSDETKMRMSKSASMRKRKPHTEESKAKMKEAAFERERVKKAAGYVVSEDTRKKLSDASKRAWEKRRNSKA